MKKRLRNKKIKNRAFKIINNIGFKTKILNSYIDDYYNTFNFKIINEKLKDWLFAVTVYNNSFEIYGENKYLIDKFKPSRCVICFNNITDFEKEVIKLIVEFGEWKQYNENVREAKKREDELHNINFLTKDSIVRAIKEFNRMNDLVELRFNDTKLFFPRYLIHLYCDREVLNNDSLYKKYLFDAYEFLSPRKYYGDINAETFLLENTTLYTREEYEDNAKIYSWNKTFDEYKDSILK